MSFKKSKVLKALYLKAKADRAKAEMALDLLENQAVGIGDHTAKDLFEDAEEALQLLVDASDKITILEEKFSIILDI